MNKFIYLLFTFILISCKKNEFDELFKEFNYQDKECFSELTRAKNDYLNGLKVHCMYDDGLTSDQRNRHSREFDSILKTKNIQLKFDAVKHFGVSDYNKENCYCRLMNKLMARDFGEEYFDSLHFLADSLWVIKNPDIIFIKGGVNGIWDKPALYPNDKFYNDEYHSGLQDLFDEQFVYDDDYELTVDGVAQIRVDVFCR